MYTPPIPTMWDSWVHAHVRVLLTGTAGYVESQNLCLIKKFLLRQRQDCKYGEKLLNCQTWNFFFFFRESKVIQKFIFCPMKTDFLHWILLSTESQKKVTWIREAMQCIDMWFAKVFKELFFLFPLEEDHSITDLCRLGNCEFCSRALKPFPTVEELDGKPEVVEEVGNNIFW